MHKLIITLLAAALATPSFAALAPGMMLYNPELAGTGEVGSGGPFYNHLPQGWINPGNLLGSLSSPIVGVPGFAQFSGTVDSAVYQAAPGLLGFTYCIRLDGNSAANLVRASLAALGWTGVVVVDAGSDQSGNSTPGTGNTTWSDGAPYFIERAASPDENPQWTFRLGTDGTTINANQHSAMVWFTVETEFWQRSTISLLDGGATGAARVLTIGIPSPAAASLGMIGLAIVGSLRRRVA